MDLLGKFTNSMMDVVIDDDLGIMFIVCRHLFSHGFQWFG